MNQVQVNIERRRDISRKLYEELARGGNDAGYTRVWGGTLLGALFSMANQDNYPDHNELEEVLTIISDIHYTWLKRSFVVTQDVIGPRGKFCIIIPLSSKMRTFFY